MPANSHMTFGVDILPKTNATYNLGNSNQKWNIFVNELNGVDISGGIATTGATVEIVRLDNVISGKLASTHIVRDGDTLNDLKDYLTVTYYNNGTTTSIAGSDNSVSVSGTIALESGHYDMSTGSITITYNNLTTTLPIKIYNAMTLDPVTLPSGYTQVAMISSDGTSGGYTNLGITSASVDHVKYGIQVIDSDITNGKNQHILSNNDTWYPFCRQGNTGARNFQGKYRTSSTSATSLTAEWTVNTDYEIEAYPDVTINGTKYDTLTAGTYSSESNFNLFIYNSGNFGKYRLYYLKMYNDQDELVSNLVPCKNSSNVAGLYDTVRNTFYAAATTSAFTAGEVV